MAKFKHNKKQNTGFLYESMILELTKAILNKDIELKNEIVSKLKESFKYGSHLHQDLKLYHSITKSRDINPYVADKIVAEVKQIREKIDQKELLQEQNNLARYIKKNLGNEAMSNFVPNYKLLATISQIFNHKVPVKTRIILENELVGYMSSSKDSQENKMLPIDNIIFKSFSKRFNESYTEKLLHEQKILISKFASSFSDNGLELKTYLNEEIGRLKEAMKESSNVTEFVEDPDMKNGAQEVISLLQSYQTTQPDKNMIQQILKIQSLVQEIKKDASN
jgi:hypothetical protein